MPQITLSVPHEKLPLLQEFLQAIGIQGQPIQNIFGKPAGDKRKGSGNNQPFSWEYFCNELEFE